MNVPPRLDERLAEQLARVPRSHDVAMDYAPCRVTLVDGRTVDRVYVQEVGEYLRGWGDDPRRSFLSIADVASIEESPSRLPAEYADRLYSAGESGMGYAAFLVDLADGRRMSFGTGNAVDFLDWPADVSPSDVVGVEPHAGRDVPERLTGAAYSWCLYSR